ncbi:MFS transporter [Achromobacter ruhlandii]|uniref:MFS transporter n=1 Tax=Achromobacter ruhlandii TaxID=72557 RepID=UPI0007BF2FE7|nr:MFS transporter [Achromobacter ruhlandii]
MSLPASAFSAPTPAVRPTHRWKVLAVGVAANAAFSAAAAGLPATAVFLRADYQLDNDALGLALGVLGLGVALFELPWGLLADRWGDRPVLLGGLGATAAALAWMSLFAAPAHGVAPALWLLALGLLLVGVMGGSVNGASGRAVMAWFDEGERGLAMSIRQTAVPLGGGLGALVLPWLASRAGFGAVFGLLAGLCAGAALLTLGWLREPDRAHPATAAGSTAASHAGDNTLTTSPRSRAATHTPIAAASSPLRDARVWRAAVAIGLLCCPQFAVLTFATVFLHDFSGAGIATLTAVMVAVQLGAMVARIASGRWTDRHGNRRAYLRGCVWLGCVLFVALAAAAWLQGAVPGNRAALLAVPVLLAAAGICASAWHGVAYTELVTLAGAARAGTALGLANTCGYLGLFLTPLALPRLVAATSWPLAWLAAGGAMLAILPLLPRPARP